MFIQLTLGRALDGDGLRRQWERWQQDVAPGAPGWLGSTGGVTADGRAVLIARFESAGAGRASAARPEQADWWATTRDLLADAEVLETDDVGGEAVKDDGAAGFVQLMRARVRDRARLEAIEAEMVPAFLELRPDVLAGWRAWLPDGSLAAIDYFSSVAEARAGEAREMPEDLMARFQEWLSLLEGTEWYDLTEPWLSAPGRAGPATPPAAGSGGT